MTQDTTELDARATASERLTAMSIDLPPVPEPVAAYLPTVRSGSLIWTSGQLPLIGGALPSTGKVGTAPDCVDEVEARRLARVAALNAVAAAAAEAGGIDRIQRIVKLVGFVASDPSFTGQPAVINGASELLADIFGAAGAHARSAIGVAALPMNAPVEIELVVEVD